MSEQERIFPIIGYGPVPWALAEQAYRTYVARWGSTQTLERLAERGGFWPEEFVNYLYNRRSKEDRDEREERAAALIEIAAILEKCSPQRVERLEKIAATARALLNNGYEFDWQVDGERVDALHTALGALPEYEMPR